MPKIFDLSEQYIYVSRAMSEGIEEITKRDYAINNQIPEGVLKIAKELFTGVVNTINESPFFQVQYSREATAYRMILDHLMKADPKRYWSAKDTELHQEVRNLASLLDNLEKLQLVPKDQRECCLTLQKFFGLLSKTGERNLTSVRANGKLKGEYPYLF